MSGATISATAMRAAVAVAAEHGVRCDDPVVMRNASNLLVHLRPAPVVARIMTVTANAPDGCGPARRPPTAARA